MSIEFTKPSNIGFIIDNPTQFMVLDYLFQLSNGSNKHPFPSITTLQQYCHISRATVVKTIKELTSKEFISYKKGNINHVTNEYTINRDKIALAIWNKGNHVEHKPTMSIDQKQAMVASLIQDNPEVENTARNVLKSKESIIKFNTLNKVEV